MNILMKTKQNRGQALSLGPLFKNKSLIQLQKYFCKKFCTTDNRREAFRINELMITYVNFVFRLEDNSETAETETPQRLVVS
jgi:hypothetical protein